jgi:hypothetical protein
VLIFVYYKSKKIKLEEGEVNAKELKINFSNLEKNEKS